ncbi:Ribonuclease/ribotoxin [Nemania abortiva]|nr:Ribonuclease/ribotoxin [Nemania abortiva]
MLVAQSLLVVATALFAPAFAAPSGLDKARLEARFSGYDCGGTLFTVAEAQNGFGDAINAIRSDVVYSSGTRTYPGVFRNGGTNFELDPSPCAGKQLLEFPILASGNPYTGGDPGLHRVVVAEHGDGTSFDQCFLMTHQGAEGNLFNKCRTY